MNKNEQIDKILQSQLAPILENLNKLPEGKEKEFLKDAIKALKQNKCLNTESFIDKFVKITGHTFNSEELKNMAKKFNR